MKNKKPSNFKYSWSQTFHLKESQPSLLTYFTAEKAMIQKGWYLRLVVPAFKPQQLCLAMPCSQQQNY